MIFSHAGTTAEPETVALGDCRLHLLRFAFHSRVPKMSEVCSKGLVCFLTGVLSCEMLGVLPLAVVYRVQIAHVLVFQRRFRREGATDR